MKKLALLALSAIGFATMAQAASAASLADQYGWHPFFVEKIANDIDTSEPLALQAAKGKALPFFTTKITSPLDKKTYTASFLGSDPSKNPVLSKISYVPIVLVVKFSNGAVLDPTKPGCGDTVSVSDRFYKGPNFNPVPLVSNGVSIGKAQVVDGLMRAQFWNLVQGTAYSVSLTPAAAVRVINVTAPAGSQAVGGVCTGSNHDIGEIDINAYDKLVQTIDKKYAKPNQFPLILTYNVFETSGGSCCILGYHSTYKAASGGTQVYSVGAYNDFGIFGGTGTNIADIHAWTHEIGEAYNDPFINNATPLWGHTGQVSGCQGNLEDGDPLTGTAFSLTYNKFAYHPQELVYYSWFYRLPSIGTGGVQSFEGTFTAGQPTVC